MPVNVPLGQTWDWRNENVSKRCSYPLPGKVKQWQLLREAKFPLVWVLLCAKVRRKLVGVRQKLVTNMCHHRTTTHIIEPKSSILGLRNPTLQLSMDGASKSLCAFSFWEFMCHGLLAKPDFFHHEPF